VGYFFKFAEFCLDGNSEEIGDEDYEFEVKVEYDMEWLAILKATNRYLYEGLERLTRAKIMKYNFMK
jgi:hypothetical protein